MNPFHEGFLVLTMNHSKIHVSTFDPENQLGPEHDAEHWAAVTHIVQPVAYSWHNLDPQH